MKKKKTKIKYGRIIKWIIILLLIGYALTGYAKGINLGYDIRRSTMPEVMVENEIDTMSAIELIDYVTGQYNAPQELIQKITMCESGHRFDVSHDGGDGWGIAGIQLNTFNQWKKEFGRPELNYDSNYDHLVLMSLAFNAGEKYRDAWTTYVAYQNGGEYRFTDRKGVKHIARCK